MSRIFFVILFSLVFQSTEAQVSASIDALVLKIPQANTYNISDLSDYIKTNFSSDTARIRAIYTWITNNINYDVAALQARNPNTENYKPQPVEDVLKTRAAVCQGYTDLFVALCTNLGIKAIMIGGYGRTQGGITPLSHAWAAAELNGSWFLFDPTWGAGYLQGNRFIKKQNDLFYKVPPEQMIKDHMPFDPVFQFINYPVNNKEFIEEKTGVNTSKTYFNYKDTLAHYTFLSHTEKLKAEARRLEASGIQNDVLRQRLLYLKKGFEVYSSNDKFDDAVTTYKKATVLYNSYIEHKNKRFSDVEDNSLRQMMDSVSYYANQTRTLLFTIVPKDDKQRQNLASFHKNIEGLQKAIISEKEFVSRFLSADKTTRQRFFSGK